MSVHSKVQSKVNLLCALTVNNHFWQQVLALGIGAIATGPIRTQLSRILKCSEILCLKNSFQIIIFKLKVFNRRCYLADIFLSLHNHCHQVGLHFTIPVHCPVLQYTKIH